MVAVTASRTSFAPRRKLAPGVGIAMSLVCATWVTATFGEEVAGAEPEATRLWLEGSIESIDGLRPQLRQGGISTRLIDVSNRVWLGRGRAAFGIGWGVQTPRINTPAGAFDAPPPQPTRPSMSLGLRYRITDASSLYAGASAAKAWDAAYELPVYRAKAGIEWKSAKSRLGFDGGRLGLQLDSGYRMSIRTRSGGVQVALRRTF